MTKDITFKKPVDELNFRELSVILVALRFHTKYWEEHYGFYAKDRKKCWEERADKWIKENVQNNF